MQGGAVSTLVLGGARSGKSHHAEALARASGLTRVYIATAAAHDGEMARRIAQHRADRGADWITVEEEIALAEAIARESTGERVVLVDCLTLWLTNLMLGEHDIPAHEAALVAALDRAAGPVILVSNEVGLGIVPDNALARRFRDAQGRLNRIVAACVPRVVFVAAGLPLVMKDAGAGR